MRADTSPRTTVITSPFAADHVLGLTNGYFALGWVLRDAIDALDAGEPDAARYILAAELDALRHHFRSH